MSIHHASFIQSQYAPLPQSFCYGAALTHLGRPPLRFSLCKGRGEVQLLRRRFGPLSVGLISRFDLPRDEVRRIARKADVRALLLNAETAQGAYGLALRSPAHIAELDISVPEEVQRAGLRQKWRNRLNRAGEARLKLSETALHPHDSHWLLDLDERQGRARGYANWPAPLTLAYARANRAQARLVEARAGGEIVAAMLFLCHGSVASYHIGWTGAHGRKLCAHNAVLWYAIRRLRQRGVERLDLGAVDTDNAPGLARFKLGTGAALRALGGTWLAVPGLVRGLQT